MLRTPVASGDILLPGIWYSEEVDVCGMPKCEGRPNATCSRNDNKVRHTQGDLFLCPDCESYRFPSKPNTRSGSVSLNVNAGREGNAPDKNSDEAGQTSNSSGTNKNKSRTVKKKSLKTRTYDIHSDNETNSGDQCVCCSSCLLAVNTDRSKVMCTICCGNFHSECSGIPEKVRKQFLDLVEHVGWVCQDCRITARSSLKKLQADVAGLSENIAQLQVAVSEMKPCCHPPERSTGVSTQTASAPTPSAPQDQAGSSDENIHRVLNDLSRRKKNVIVCGLPEESGGDDSATFQRLCEDHLGCKPFVLGCKRLGEHNPQQPRRLLVRLRNETVASELLYSSRSLRAVTNPSTVQSIYINPDLTPAAAKLAFEERKKRRLKKLLAAASTDKSSRCSEAETHSDTYRAEPGCNADCSSYDTVYSDAVVSNSKDSSPGQRHNDIISGCITELSSLSTLKQCSPSDKIVDFDTDIIVDGINIAANVSVLNPNASPFRTAE